MLSLLSPLRRTALIFTACLGVPAFAPAQAAAAAAAGQKITAYDVATIRPGKLGQNGWSMGAQSNIFVAQNVELKALLENAYGIRQDLVSGAPGWAEAARYDIQAKIVDADPEALKNLTDTDRRILLQRLLSERFHLKVHTEIRTLPLYELLQAKGGSKLKPFDPTSPKRPGNEMHGMSTSMRFSSREATLTANELTLVAFVRMLEDQVRRTVVNKTGLAGVYSFVLTWAPDLGAAPSPEATAPPLFTALQEQLGLKLEASKGPVEVLIVDHVEQPTEN